MKRMVVLVLLVFLSVLPAYSGGLSKSIEFDRLVMHARNAVTRGDYRTAAENYAQAAKLRMEPSEGFYLDYAGILGALGKWKDAKNVLQTYFEHFDKQGTYYGVALRRYVDAEDKVARHSEERVKPEPLGMGAPVSRVQVAPAAVKLASTQPAASTLPPTRPTQMDRPADQGRAALERLIGLYSGETKDTDNVNRSSSTCDKTFSANKPHPASDCFYGYHRSMSLNAVDGTALVGFVKVEYVREHRPASTGDQRDRKLTLYTKMEYYLAIRLWMTPGGLIQGQQKALCEFMVDERVCTGEGRNEVTPLRAKLTADGAIGLESEKGGGPRRYAKVRTMPDTVRSDVARAIPSLGAYVAAPANRQDHQDRPAEMQARPKPLGDTAGLTDDSDDSIAAGVATAAGQIFKAGVVG